MKKLRDNKGMTIVEIMVVMVLALMIAGIAYMIFGVGLKSYQGTATRVDVQSQFRLAVDILEKELGYAEYVYLDYYSDTDSIPLPDPKGNYLYLKPVGGGMYSLCKKSSSGESVYASPYALGDFSMSFQMDPTVVEANILTLMLEAKGAERYTTGILIQNTNISVSSTSGYNTVYYEEY